MTVALMSFTDIQNDVSAILQELNKSGIDDISKFIIDMDLQMILANAKALYNLCEDYHD